MLPDRDLGAEALFPDLQNLGYTITSPQTNTYNCIAWAAKDDTHWWQPDPFFQFYWPPSAPRIPTVEAYIVAYQSVGFQQCSDSENEDGFEKITIFTDRNGAPTHASREIPDRNTWTSKLGESYDIDHHSHALDGGFYGMPTVFMKKPIALV